MKEILIKTFKANDYKYAIALLEQGEIFFQHVNNFREVENDDQRNDSIEGQNIENIMLDIDPSVEHFSIGSTNGKRYIVNWAAAKKDHPELNCNQLNFRITYTVDWLIYCMTYVNSSMKNLQNIYETINKLGEYSVVITDCKAFVNRIEDKIKIVHRGLVNYSNDKIQNPFMKRKDLYEGQSEYRFATEAKGQKSKIIRIGAIEGFLCSSKDIDIIELYLKN